jgi:recombination protein RecA
MSSAVVPTSAAQGRPFVFEVEDGGEACPRPSGADLNEARPPQREVPAVFTGALKDKDARLASVTPASRLAVRPALEMVSCGIAEMDALTGGFPRSCLTEISGPTSSGRTTVLLAALAAATRRGEFCAVVDASDALDPQSVVAAGVELDRLLWVRCGENLPRRHPSASLRAGSDTEKKNLKGRQISKFDEGESRHAEYGLEQLLRATDLLLESGGFGLIALDLGDLPPQTARRIPLTTWFRFRRAVEHTPTVLLAIERQSIAGSCSSLLIKLGSMKSALSGESQFQLPTHAQLMTDLEIRAELVRSTLDRNLDRKPVRSAETTFASKTAWAG